MAARVTVCLLIHIANEGGPENGDVFRPRNWGRFPYLKPGTFFGSIGSVFAQAVATYRQQNYCKGQAPSGENVFMRNLDESGFAAKWL